jgi:hypothetical protein
VTFACFDRNTEHLYQQILVSERGL